MQDGNIQFNVRTRKGKGGWAFSKINPGLFPHHMKCNTTTFSGHAIVRMFDRGLSKDEVVTAIRSGETVFNYPDEQPYPSRLLLGLVKGIPIHVVVARDETDYSCYVVTAYVPSSELWHADFKTRKQQ